MSDLVIGIDLGGTTIKTAAADTTGRILARTTIKTESHIGPDGVITRIGDVAEKLVAKVASRDDSLVSVGMGVPGLVNLETGTTEFLPNLPTQWRDVPVAETLRSRLGCSVSLMNDARVATLGELRFGHGKDVPHATLAFFSIGTGIGGGVAIDGKLRPGPLGSAGELGHQTILPDGPLCGCGNRGCLETLASGPALAAEGVRLMRSGLAPTLHKLCEGNADRVTPETMSEAAPHDRAVRRAITRAAKYVGIAAANVITILHPDFVVFGGGVSSIRSNWLETIRDVVNKRVGMFPTKRIRIVRSSLGDQAGLMGAIALAVQRFQETENQPPESDEAAETKDE